MYIKQVSVARLKTKSLRRHKLIAGIKYVNPDYVNRRNVKICTRREYDVGPQRIKYTVGCIRYLFFALTKVR